MSVSTLIPFDLSFNLKENTTFTQYAYDISGAQSGGLAGHSISKNLAGDIIAVGAPLNSGGGTARGEVRVYQKNNDSWLQLGNELNGEADNDNFGHSVDLNGDGTILGVGSKDISNNALYVYKYDGSTWNQYGNTIKVFKDSNISFNESSFIQGSKVKLNKEGNKLVTSNKYNITNNLVSTINQSISDYAADIGCTNSWDFRQNASAYVTDDIGGVKCWFYTDTYGHGNGTSDSTNGASVSLASNQQNVAVIDKGLFIDSGFTYGGVSSVEMYIYITEYPDWSRLWYWGSSPSTAYGFGSTNSSTQKLTVYLDGTASNGNSYMNYITSQFTLNSWIHVVQTIDSAGDVKLYENGALKASRSLGTNYLTSSIKTTTDKKYGAIGSYGDYDDSRGVIRGIEAQFKYFRYYHGKALSASEVTDLYDKKDTTSMSTTVDISTNYDEELVQAYEYSSPSWNQIGNTIESSSLHDISGGDIAINDEGNMIAIGYPQTNSATGTTKVYKYDTSWNQVGSNIDGSATGDHAGTSVVMDGSGDFVAIGSPFANITETDSVTSTTVNGVQVGTQIDGDDRVRYLTGIVFGRSSAAISGSGNRIFTAGNHAIGQNYHGDLKIADWNGSQWNTTLDISSFSSWIAVNDYENREWGKYYYVNFGYGVSSSYDGNTVAIGAPNGGSTEHGESADLGLVFIWKWDGSEWKITAEIGPGTREFGHTVNLNKSPDPSIDGTVVLIGEEYNNNACGAVSVYEYDGTSWNQKGQTIVGSSEDYMETSACINSDGTIFACGSWKRNRVLVYEWNDSSSTWTLKSNISRPSGASGSHFGSTTQMTGDGLTIVIGAIDSRYNNYTGEVYVYEWDGSAWQQKGQTITNTGMGHKVTINNDGTVLAVSGVSINSDNYTEAGKVLTYQWNGSDWEKFGAEYYGQETEEHLGDNIQLNSSGSHLLTTGKYAKVWETGLTNTVTTITNWTGGKVNVYKNINNSWNLYGNVLKGQADNDEFGSALDMTPEGNILAVGAPNANGGKGNINIYQYNETDSSWNQLGGDLSGTEVGDLTGTSVKLNQLGTEVSVGEPDYNTSGRVRTFELSHTKNYEANTFQSSYLDGFLDISGGELRTRNADDHLLIGGDASMSGNIFVKGNETIENKNMSLGYTLIDISFSQLENTNFTQYAYDISGAESAGLAGHSISTSASGDIIAVGAPLNSGGGTARGEVRVYQKDNNSWLQLGNDLNGAADNDNFGHSVDLNGDGTILGVGSKDTSNNLIVYKYDGSAWNQYGNNIHVVNNNISYNTHSLTPAIKVKLNKEGNKLVTMNKYNVTDRQVSSTIVTHTSPYVTAGCTNNWDFRQNASGYVTDDIGGVKCWLWQKVTASSYGGDFEGGSTDINDGALLKLASTPVLDNLGLIDNGLFVDEGFTHGGVSSFEVYMNFSNWENFGRLVYWGSGPGAHDGTYGLGVTNQSNNKYAAYVSGQTSTGNSWNYYYSTTELPSNSWIHIVQTVESNGSIKLYLNGTLYSSTTVNSTYVSNSVKTISDRNFGAIGCYPEVGDHRGVLRGLDANIRFFRYYHGKALSASEVLELYNDRDDTSTATGRDGTTPEGTNTVTTDNSINYENEIVQTYEYSSPSWNQIGNSIESSVLNDISGGDIAINDEGNMIAIGYPQTNSATGTTKVYKYDTSWNQIGSNIDGSATGDYAGTSVVIDGSGDFVAIGSPFTGDASAGEVNVYQNVSDTWTLYGNKIQGQADNDQFGTSIDIDPSGTILAVGAVNANGGKGNVNIYQYNTTDSSWNKVGGDLSGAEVGDLTGTSVKLNQLGTEVSVGEPTSNNIPPYYEAFSQDSTKYLDWNFLVDSTTSVTDTISNKTGTYYRGSNSTNNSGTSNTTDGFIVNNDGGSGNGSIGSGYGVGVYNTGVSLGNTTKFAIEMYFDTTPSGNVPRNLNRFMLFEMQRSQTSDDGWVGLKAGSYWSLYWWKDSNKNSVDSIDILWPSDQNDVGKHHAVFQLESDGSTSKYNMGINGAFVGQQTKTTTWGLNWSENIFLNLFGEHNFTGPSGLLRYPHDVNIIYFRIYRDIEFSDAELLELYNNREPISGTLGGARTFEIEHTKIYEHEYNTQSNSVIVGHNEYSRNQFATALDVSGNVDVSGNITVTGNITIPGDITLDALNYNSINKAPPVSIDYSDITEDLSFNHKIEIMTNDNSLQTTSLTIHNDLSNNGTFGSSFVYDNSLSVTGSVVVVDASNTNYGSYTVYSKGDGSDSFMVGKSASHVFNIVNQSNVGVWLQIDGNSFISTSDERLKKDIEDLGEETNSIMKLRPVKFHWNYEEEDKEKHIGFIAQEVEELFPDLVEENTYPDGSTYKGVDKTKLIPHLVNEIKSIKKEIEELKK